MNALSAIVSLAVGLLYAAAGATCVVAAEEIRGWMVYRADRSSMLKMMGYDRICRLRVVPWVLRAGGVFSVIIAGGIVILAIRHLFRW